MVESRPQSMWRFRVSFCADPSGSGLEQDSCAESTRALWAADAQRLFRKGLVLGEGRGRLG